MSTTRNGDGGNKTQSESGQGIATAGQQLLQLKRELSLARRILQGEPEDSACGSLAHDMERWDGVVDEVRQAMIALTTTHDLLQIAHDKLKERVDGNALKPRELRPRQGRVSPSVPHMSAASGAQPLTGSQSQDFTAIDAELAKLNESMFKAIAER